jgi:SAM-dependent methyltransferase
LTALGRRSYAVGRMSAPNVYDAVAYPGFAHAQTHPDRLSTIAALFGMRPAPPERCRVLEVGCGDGRNLIAMASALPQSTFVGFDLAGQPIASGREMLERLGLKNVTLTRQDLMSVTPELGRFDYVIAHGFYAWVPRPVQDRLLSLCRDVLAPEGVAYVSYNAYPGCRLRELFRDIMQVHERGVEEPAARIAAAKASVDFVRRNLPGASDYGSWMLNEMEKLVQQDPGALYHDTLGEVYSPCTFLEFMQRAGGQGLQYLGEAEFLEMNDEPFPPEAVEKLRSFGPERLLEKEQLMDFLKMRSFRQTLLCRDSVALRRAPASEDLSRFHVSTRARAVSSPSPSGAVEYRTAKGATMATESPVFQRLMARLENVWPGSLPFPELAGLCGDAAAAAQLIVRLYGMAIVDLYPSPPRFARGPGATPAVSALVRLQNERSPLVTNRLHADVRIDGAAAKELVRRLDGRRSRAALLRDLAAAGAPLTPEALEAGLHQLARLALLTE